MVAEKKGKSKKPRKQHKKLYKMALHKKRKKLSAALSKSLRQRYGRRNFPIRKEDKVKIMRGKNKGKSGKITEINLKKGTIGVEKITFKKPDGTEKAFPINPSNVQITDLSLGDKKREDALKRSSRRGKIEKTVEKRGEKQKETEKIEEEKGE